MEYDPYNPRGPKKTGGPPKKARKAAARKVSQKAAGKDGTEAQDGAMFSEEETGEAAVNTVAAGQLRAFVERVERLEEDKQAVADDIKEVYAEAKGSGFDTKALRTIVKLRKKDQAERQEEESMVDLYKAALGMA